MEENTTEKKLEIITQLARDKKAENVIILDVEGTSDLTDRLVICSGDGDIHTRAIGKYIIEEAKKMGVPIHHKEGLENGKWILVDFGVIVMHIFDKETRDYYKLEDLWEELVRNRKKMKES
ncbi:MAG: ribosome silencing factor [Candidatus Celaenobacter antarcticus]|nr:ribosome silencing factor [Candidatus Celaenobacter antarcticus]